MDVDMHAHHVGESTRYTIHAIMNVLYNLSTTFLILK